LEGFAFTLVDGTLGVEKKSIYRVSKENIFFSIEYITDSLYKMKYQKIVLTIFLWIVFFAGIMAILSLSSMKENMEDNTTPTTPSNNSCPDLLVQNGNVLLLYNRQLPIGNGNNPIPFANLDEYITYVENQRNLGNDCPVLYLQNEYNAQGNQVYRIRPSPFELEAGLPSVVPPTYSNQAMSTAINQYTNNVGLSSPIAPQMTPVVTNVVDASRENGAYNANQYAGFDPHGQYVGVYTNVDQIHYSTANNQLSDNPLDPNWGGVEYTNQSIQSGKYADNNITKPLLFQPRGEFIPPRGSSGFPPPVDILYSKTNTF
jgi:hypothetical protein